MTQAELRETVARATQSWLGRKEADGSHREIIDLYNSHKPLARGYAVKYTDAWCAAFGSAVAIQAGLTDIIPTECGCEEQIKRFQAMDSWVEDDAYVPSPGDYIFYDWDDSGAGDCTGRADHVGIVTACDGKTVTVIEGNKNNAVSYRTLAVNGRYIRGYGVPNYGSLATEAPAQDLPWYEPYRRWAMEQGITDGTRGSEPATRAECWAMLKRLSEKG